MLQQSSHPSTPLPPSVNRNFTPPGERTGHLGHRVTVDRWGREGRFRFTAGRRESQLVWKTPHGHSRMLSVCLWGPNSRDSWPAAERRGSRLIDRVLNPSAHPRIYESRSYRLFGCCPAVSGLFRECFHTHQHYSLILEKHFLFVYITICHPRKKIHGLCCRVTLRQPVTNW